MAPRARRLEPPNLPTEGGSHPPLLETVPNPRPNAPKRSGCAAIGAREFCRGHRTRARRARCRVICRARFAEEEGCGEHRATGSAPRLSPRSGSGSRRAIWKGADMVDVLRPSHSSSGWETSGAFWRSAATEADLARRSGASGRVAPRLRLTHPTRTARRRRTRPARRGVQPGIPAGRSPPAARRTRVCCGLRSSLRRPVPPTHRSPLRRACGVH